MSLLSQILVKQVTRSVQIQEMSNRTPLSNGNRSKELVACFNLPERKTSQGRMAHRGTEPLKEGEERC